MKQPSCVCGECRKCRHRDAVRRSRRRDVADVLDELQPSPTRSRGRVLDYARFEDCDRFVELDRLIGGSLEERRAANVEAFHALGYEPREILKLMPIEPRGLLRMIREIKARRAAKGD